MNKFESASFKFPDVSTPFLSHVYSILDNAQKRTEEANIIAERGKIFSFVARKIFGINLTPNSANLVRKATLGVEDICNTMLEITSKLKRIPGNETLDISGFKINDNFVNAFPDTKSCNELFVEESKDGIQICLSTVTQQKGVWFENASNYLISSGGVGYKINSEGELDMLNVNDDDGENSIIWLINELEAFRNITREGVDIEVFGAEQVILPLRQ